MKRRKPRNPWSEVYYALNRGSGAGYLRPMSGRNTLALDDPGLRSDRCRGLRSIRGCQPISPAGL